MPQFDINLYFSQIFWLIVTFGCLYISVHKFIVPMAERVLNNRQSFIDDKVSSSEILGAKAKILQEQYVSELEKISNKTEIIKKDAKILMEKAFLLKRKQLKDELKVQIEANYQNIKTSTKLFWENGDDICINLATILIQKITDTEVNLDLLTESYKKIKNAII